MGGPYTMRFRKCLIASSAGKPTSLRSRQRISVELAEKALLFCH